MDIALYPPQIVQTCSPQAGCSPLKYHHIYLELQSYPPRNIVAQLKQRNRDLHITNDYQHLPRIVVNALPLAPNSNNRFISPIAIQALQMSQVKPFSTAYAFRLLQHLELVVSPIKIYNSFSIILDVQPRPILTETPDLQSEPPIAYGSCFNLLQGSSLQE